MRRLALIGLCLAAIGGGAAAVLPGLGGVAAGRSASPHAKSAHSTTFAGNRRLARAFAQRGLRSFAPVPGATRTAADPAVNGVLKVPVTRPGGTRLIDRHHFWRVSADPKAVLRWFKHHPPAKTSPGGGGTGSNRAGPYEWSLMFSYRHLPGYLSEGELDVSVSAARGGGTALRIDSFATPLVPRPKWEHVPRSARRVTITATVQLPATGDAAARQATYPVMTLTHPASVHRLIRFVNSRPIEQPGLEFSCPAILSPTLSLSFSANAGSAALATVRQGSCGYATFRLGGRGGPALLSGDLVAALWRLHALPACHPSTLTASDGGVRSQRPGPASYAVTIGLRHTGTTACGLGGFPRVRLLGRSGKRLPTHASDRRTEHSAALLTPQFGAQSTLSWSDAPASCRAPRARRIALAMPRARGWLTFAAGSHRRAVAPCHGRVRVGPIEPNWRPNR